MPIDSILVPVALDDRARRLLRYASGLSEQSVRRALLVTFVDTSGMESAVEDAERERARGQLEAMSAELDRSGLEIGVRVLTGDPAKGILRLAEDERIDVVCLGTEGKTTAGFLFAGGSVSESVFTSGQVRTMAVRYSLFEEVGGEAALARDFGRRVVVPTDFSTSATKAWLSVFDRPASAIGEAYALHVTDPGADERVRARADAQLAGLVDIAAEHGVIARPVVREGANAAEVALEFLAEIGATGVITGRTGRRLGALRPLMLGSLSLRLLREAPCPVVVQP